MHVNGFLEIWAFCSLKGSKTIKRAFIITYLFKKKINFREWV
jgi:hypothetical protein